MKNYMKAVIHALALLIYRRDEAVEIASGEPMRLMEVSDGTELRRQVDSIAAMLHVKPYPTAEAIVNTNAIAAHEYGARIRESGHSVGPPLGQSVGRRRFHRRTGCIPFTALARRRIP